MESVEPEIKSKQASKRDRTLQGNLFSISGVAQSQKSMKL